MAEGRQVAPDDILLLQELCVLAHALADSRLPRGSPARSWHAGRHSADVTHGERWVDPGMQDKINKLPTKRPHYWTCDMPLSVSSPYSKHP